MKRVLSKYIINNVCKLKAKLDKSVISAILARQHGLVTATWVLSDQLSSTTMHSPWLQVFDCLPAACLQTKYYNHNVNLIMHTHASTANSGQWQSDAWVGLK